ncbi:hypothetical protein DIPPA_18657 [Diplonema papillatum]|nr:hypothetical protein DIPPA_18657 [Diplonema papillatum]
MLRMAPPVVGRLCASAGQKRTVRSPRPAPVGALLRAIEQQRAGEAWVKDAGAFVVRPPYSGAPGRRLRSIIANKAASLPEVYERLGKRGLTASVEQIRSARGGPYAVGETTHSVLRNAA